MASDYTPTNVTSGFEMEVSINKNFDEIKTAMDKLLSRELPTDNALEQLLDTNGFDIINLPLPSTPTSPVRLKDLDGSSILTLDIADYFNHTSALAAAGDLGDFVRTAEFSVGSGDGGGLYKIVSSDPGFSSLNKVKGDGNFLQLLPQDIIFSSQAGVVDGTGQDTKVQDCIDYAETFGSADKHKTVKLSSGLSLLNSVEWQLKVGVDLDCRGVQIKSTDLTDPNIVNCLGDNVVTGGYWSGGEDATTVNSRKVRAIIINKNITTCDNVTVKEGVFRNFRITSVYCEGDRDNIPRGINVHNTVHYGTDIQLQAITIFCGDNVSIQGNQIFDMDSLPILIDEATIATPLPNYGVLTNINISNNIIVFNAPTNASVLYGIQATSVQNIVINGNSITGLPTNTGRGIVVTIYDLAQQKTRVEVNGETGPFLPIVEQEARVVISNNTITSAGSGIFVGGFTSPIISNNNIVAGKPVVLLPIAATIDAVSYTFPSTDDTGLSGTNMGAMVNGNILISTDVATEVIDISSNRNYFLDNNFSGAFSTRYAATNNLSTHVVRDSDQSMGVSGTLLLGTKTSGVVTFSSSEGATSISFVEGGSNVLERFLDYIPTDYIPVIATSWDSGWSIPNGPKTNSGFQINFATNASSGDKLYWHIVHSENFRP